ncbi:uncharacterized protein DUF4157 [Chitinophaga niastensis]|uniref:Uncharacterized protein DUF4157 n=1 Tax=Chitinophaga niastensis TaxID=536980 RepID=A0A2P8HGM1_CHINA|nr:DUF4157 domain-containing protein [Chitinophaga niastensis]PSL45354.1 uncharacterized protein DUF4157 [Chitinophaga niastensis]
MSTQYSSKENLPVAQRAVANRNTTLHGISLPAPVLQKQPAMEEELAQKKSITQFKTTEEEETSLPAQAKFVLQRAILPEEEKPAQGKFVTQFKPNLTGMPDQLKSGVENMSGMDLSAVKVHYNSDKPAQLNAHAYAQGNDIHLGAGQEKHLPHEAWHVVQQRQGRVQATMQMKQGIPVNDDPGLESEADTMGAKAMQLHSELPPEPEKL